MAMYRVAVILSAVCTTLSQDAFLEKYSFTKTMASCFGEDVYYKALAEIGQHQRECQQLPVSSLHRLDFSIYSQIGYPLHFGGDSAYVPYPNYHPVHPGQQYQTVPHTFQQLHYRKKRQAETAEEQSEEPATQAPEETEEGEELPQAEAQVQVQAAPSQPDAPFFDRYYLIDSVNRITAALSNYTCTLHKLGTIDEYLNLNVDQIVDHYANLPISAEFAQDLVDGIYYCRDMTYCLPLNNNQRSPLPLNLQRLLMAMECEKETRTNACFKEDLRKNIDEFDLTLFSQDETQEDKLVKLSAIITGVDSLTDLEIL